MKKVKRLIVDKKSVEKKRVPMDPPEESTAVRDSATRGDTK